MVYDITPSPGNSRNTEGDTIPLADGRLLVAWSRFGGPRDHDRADVCAISSSDWDETWSEQSILVSCNEAVQNVMSVSLLREAATGDVLLFYLRKNSLADCQIFLRRSSNEAKTWSPPTRVSTRPGYHVMNNARVVQLETGTLLAPVALAPDYAVSRRQAASCYLSSDGGFTWQPGCGCVGLPGSDVGCQEPGLVPLDVDLLMYIRSDKGYIYAARSTDGGDTWTEPWPLRDLPAPAAPATITLLPDGTLAVIYNHRPDGARAGWAGRTPLAMAQSSDDGRTWHRLRDIESSPEYCYGYTSLRVYGDRVALTYYVWPRREPSSFSQTALRFQLLPLAEFARL